MTATRHLTGRFPLALSPAAAFPLFTARGEERWVPGWQPRFPVSTVDDSEPGTVFETTVDGECTTWIVLDREPDRRISYARVTPGSRAGTVTVEIEPSGTGCTVTVTYRLTPLSPAGERALADFAAEYPEFLRSWETMIKALG
ncbi:MULTISPECIES: SRPBCC family protein [unclassified Crossiella]|uniref:SRPBCC family protein n=1 Tax=unclassified Crossiella TaxID=2620835 RepID=UPI0020003BAC|nr:MULTISPECIES: SRPBCC family protein [unclassified Crossiella]MCK2244186.1 SRPBCC family protein [Crossiella sp. S99.2]MCK2257990.1 SRPBCC family protein [Crossiella sp. S99.1]